MQASVILLFILKTAGIILLSLLGIILLLIVILLFYPCFYSADGSFIDNAYNVDAVAKWLFVKFTFKRDNNNTGGLSVILPFGINSREHREKKMAKKRRKELEKRHRQRKKADKNALKKIGKTKDNKMSVKQKTDDGILKKYETGADTKPSKDNANLQNTDDKNPVSRQKNDKTNFNKTRVKKDEKKSNRNVSAKISSVCSAVKKAVRFPHRAYAFAMEKYAEIAELDKKYGFKAVYKETLRFFKKFFSGLGLKKFHFYGIIGLDDPADTGMLIGAASTMSMFIPFPVSLEGSFDQKKIDLNISLKGRTSLFGLLYPVGRYILSKPVLPLVKEYIKKQ